MLRAFQLILTWLREWHIDPATVSVTIRFGSMHDRLRAQTILNENAGRYERGLQSPPAMIYGIAVKFTDPTDD